MTLYDFNGLDFNNKMKTVNQYGKFLENTLTNNKADLH